jgi:hypothetical protein
MRPPYNLLDMFILYQVHVIRFKRQAFEDNLLKL